MHSRARTLAIRFVSKLHLMKGKYNKDIKNKGNTIRDTTMISWKKLLCLKAQNMSIQTTYKLNFISYFTVENIYTIAHKKIIYVCTV